MADGVDITAGTGTKILTDDTGASGHAQIFKLGSSADGSAAVVPASPLTGLLVDGLPGSFDTFGRRVVGESKNLIDLPFYRDTLANMVTVSTASGGTASTTNGMATFACTTTASSNAKGVTLQTNLYTGGSEVYSIFTAGFTGSGSGTSYQRIGLYDTNNGVFIGYEGGTFNVTIRKGASDTSTAKASFSVDTLTGAAGSLFTRNGTPEAIDLTKLNVWRIRFGWVGSAPIHFEVLSPDGRWVTFHTIKQPNLAALPSMNTADLPITCDVFGGNSSAALTIITNCWVAGVTTSQSPAKNQVAAQTTVSNSSTTLAIARPSRVGIVIVNRQNVAIYIDPSGGTASTSTGFRLDAGDSVTIAGQNAITAITAAAYTASGDAKVHTIDEW
jgi:hypothetical protein